MRRTFRSRMSGLVAGALMALCVATPAEGLTCGGFEDRVAAAEEAVAGDHPLWARAYIIGRVDEVIRDDGLRVRVTPTHVFSGTVGSTLWLAARPDGPPDPGSWHVGERYFIALEGPSGIDTVDAIVAPCAPNFRIGDPALIDRLMAASPDVEIRELAPASASGDSALWPVGLLGGIAIVLAIGSVLAFRRRGTVTG